MLRRVSLAVLGVYLVFYLTGCKNPMAPDGGGDDGGGGTPIPRTFTVVSGENFRPVRADRAFLFGNASGSEIPVEIDSEGRIIVEDIRGGGDQSYSLAIEADGFLRRQVPPFSSKDEITLWPDRPGFEAQFTKELLYRFDRILRPINNTIKVDLSNELRRDRNAFENHKRAVQIVMDAFNNHIRPPENPIRVELVGFNDTGSPGSILTVSVDRSISPGSGVNFQFDANGGSQIHAAQKAYSSVGEARQIHKILQSYSVIAGLSEISSSGGVMNNRGVSVSDFSNAEKLAMRLSLLRQPGHRFPDSGS